MEETAADKEETEANTEEAGTQETAAVTEERTAERTQGNDGGDGILDTITDNTDQKQVETMTWNSGRFGEGERAGGGQAKFQIEYEIQDAQETAVDQVIADCMMTLKSS